jgi:hypothetical protein
MSNGKTYTGSCFCGAVQLTVNGEPVAMGYCHCELGEIPVGDGASQSVAPR